MSWQAAREHCRELGRLEGVSDADLAYFDDATERDYVIAGRPCLLFKQDL